MKNILLTIAYDGSLFHGWQRQLDERTVQGELEKALSETLGKAITIDGTSRTDAGVHALGQRASFCCDTGVPTDKLPMILNNHLAKGRIFNERIPGEIFIVDAEEVAEDFHARFNAVGKSYIYKISIGKKADIFRRNYYYQMSKSPDLKKMKEAATHIIGTHDFKSFETAGGTPRESTVRTVFDLRIDQREEKCSCDNSGKEIVIEIKGDGFLYNMVRIITGTLVEVGLAKRTAESVKDTIEALNREEAGHTAPPSGLYLKEVYYEHTK